VVGSYGAGRLEHGGSYGLRDLLRSAP